MTPEPSLAQLRQRLTDAVNVGESVGDDGDPDRIAVPRNQLGPFAREHGGGRDVGDDR